MENTSGIPKPPMMSYLAEVWKLERHAQLLTISTSHNCSRFKTKRVIRGARREMGQQLSNSRLNRGIPSAEASINEGWSPDSPRLGPPLPDASPLSADNKLSRSGVTASCTC